MSALVTSKGHRQSFHEFIFKTMLVKTHLLYRVGWCKIK